MKESRHRAGGELAEVQGLYGPLRLLEVQVQRCWAGQELSAGDWRLRDGRRLVVRHAGTWNRGAGPDFRDAVLEIDGELRVGDVELHLYREDWWRHGHETDPAFGWVVLHVVLFGGGMPREARGVGGEVLPEWVMGPWLREDLEAVSGGEPGLWGEQSPELAEWIRGEVVEVVREGLVAGCDRRWEGKESMAAGLLREVGWEGALHRLVLYYLGFPANRGAFYEMAERLPRLRWAEAGLVEQVRATWEGDIRWGVGRPANQPEARLRIYARLNQEVGDWVDLLGCVPKEFGEALTGKALAGGGTRAVRREGRVGEILRWLEEEVLGGVVSASLVRRLWIDVFLPVLVGGGRLDRDAGRLLFFHSPPASAPDGLLGLARDWRVRADDGEPQSNGWLQGMLRVESQLRVERLRDPTR